jgi:hypothetical protein
MPMGKDIKAKYAKDFKANRKLFEHMFADHHPEEHLVRFYIGTSTDYREQDGFVWMVMDYEPTLPLEGGGLEQPRWTYDFDFEETACAALMAVPAGRRQDPIQGRRVDGRMMRPISGDEEGDEQIIVEILTGALQFGKLGGPPDHALRIEDISMIVKSELTEWLLRVYSGDIECVTLPFLSDTGDLSIVDHGYTPTFSKTVPASAIAPTVVDDGSTITTTYVQPEWTHHFGGIQRTVGRAFKVRITVDTPDDFHFSGLMLLYKLGQSNRQPANVTVQSIG